MTTKHKSRVALMKIHPVIAVFLCGSLVFAAILAGTNALQGNATATQQILSSHALIRTNIIGLELPQIAELTPSFNVLLGDSIIEALYTGPSSIPIVNAGVGGGGVDSTLAMLDKLAPYKGRIDTVILGIGVNDAYSGIVNYDRSGRSAYLQKWAGRYEEIINRSKELAHAVYLVPILPVENNKELGTKYFDVDMINHMNKKIIEMSVNSGALVVSLPVKLTGNGNGIANPDSTTDGVHPTAQTYTELRRSIMDIFREREIQKNKN